MWLYSQDSQSEPIDRSKPEARFRKTCARQVSGGTCGSDKMAVWVDSIIEPFSNKTVIPGLTGVLGSKGVENWRKCPVALVSAMI